MIILDTNVVSALMQETPDGTVLDWLDQQPLKSVWTTAITVLESRFGLNKMAPGRRRAKLEDEFEQLISEDLEDRVLAFDYAAAEQTGALMARQAAKGRPMEFRDSMIAGIALARRATLATRNVRHFDDIGIDLVDPWQASAG
jgi:predicted nucleic acid-binding protein